MQREVRSDAVSVTEFRLRLQCTHLWSGHITFHMIEAVADADRLEGALRQFLTLVRRVQGSGGSGEYGRWGETHWD